MRTSAAVIGPALALIVLVACGKGNADRVAPINDGQRILVLNAVEQLRTALDDGTCESVPDLFAEHLRTGKLSQGWAERCRHVRETWGDWRSFGANYWYRAGGSAIAVEGIAEFTKGNCVVQVVWDLQSASPRMLAFFLRSKEDQVDFPSLRPRLYFDPPPRNGREVGLSERPSPRLAQLALWRCRRVMWPATA